jgi:hypothetical protein
MSILLRTLNGVQNTLGCIREILGYGLKFLLALCQPQATRLLASESRGGLHHRYVRVAA